MSSEAVTEVTDLGARRSNRRQEKTIRKVLDAAVELLHQSSYSDLTMRAVAAKAGVAPATAYTYFSSKNALIAEVYLRRVQAVPLFTDVNQTTQQRVTSQLHELALLVADEPEVAAATTTALMGDEPELRQVREKIGMEVRRRIASALGPGAWPEVLSTLEMIFYGALVQAGSGSITYYQMADRLDSVIALIMGSAEW
ncbi:helix-turn-helix domain-containing protein [Mycobacterium sp.]|jgi:AcrR family transcriptional regulator|uniref:TetR/AcrR family transcriptional regulator n=1 Tax=Mycobacterium sp. TaxID=1785 RepID=UPI002D720B46|nr:helix-turn-helix domain-containing protein [Mycobacterium sp.]HZA08792.1 helix-turn-helix domain-containing protein [Mycobacterium sp.]